ncbi:hypothetical protein A0O34_16605 [Chryseobacterium glaciei]|uniref:Uncharacterized protein n=1 Tax=Chryseobacterium glaciei TaxID=1685010 RepID=A0A172XZ02_9FLAO|nr:hypothetical protein [Chryseobacterium glaciei]ANF52035.1 hypothetical protein A0O34_16605 [Chryseobacterium glaciei]
MKAAKPVEKDNKANQNQSKKQKQKEPMVVHQSEAEVAATQIQKTGSQTVVTGSGNPNNNLVGRNGSNPMTQTIYDQGSEIMYGRFQESLKQTGDVNHPDTKKAEKDYMSTKNVSQGQDYNDHKSGTSLPKTSQDESTKSKAESQEVLSELIPESGGHDKKKKNEGKNQKSSNEKIESHLIKIEPNQHYENQLISTDEQLDRFAENQMKLTRKLNWGKLGDDFVQKLVKTGGTINYQILLNNDIVAKEIADLPEEKKKFLQNSDTKLQSLVLLDLLKELSPAEMADFKSKTTAESSSSKDIENSLRKYIQDRNLRKKENDQRESITRSFTGSSMIEVYHKYKTCQKSQGVVDDYPKNNKHEGAVPDIVLKEAHNDFYIFEQAAKAMGYTTNEFISLIHQYEVAFRKETIHIAEDVLQKYHHTLFEQKKKLLEDAFLTNLLGKIKASKAKESYRTANGASAGASGMAFAEKPTDKERSFGQEMKALAISKETEGNNAIGSLSSTTPLVQDNGFNKEGFANVETKQELRNFLANYISDQEANIARIIKNLNADQGLSIYGYASLLEKSKEQQGIAKDSIFDLIITDKESEESTKHIIEGLLIGVLAVALGLLSFGTGTVALLLAAGNFALSAYLTYEEIDKYRTQLAAYKVDISQDEPSAVWIIISVVGSALDAAAVAKISSKLVKAGRVFEKSKNITQTRKLLTDANLDPATQEKVIKALNDDLARAKALETKIQQNTVKQAELKVDIKQSLNKAQKSAFTVNTFVNPEFAIKLLPIAVKYVKSGVLSFEKFLFELQAAKIIKEIEKLSSEELSLLRKTFEDAKSLAKENEELADFDISTMREIAKNAGDIHAQNIIKGLKGKKIPQDEIDQIIIRCKYIDVKLGNTQMSEIVDKLANSHGFKNPEDLLDILRVAFEKPNLKGKKIYESAEVISKSTKDLLNELETGLKELDKGHEVIISRKIRPDGTRSGYDKLEKGGNEIDVLNITERRIIESKRVIGSDEQVKVNIKSIMGKFNTETRLSTANKDLYPNHFGQIKIDNPNNSYFNLNKQQFIDKIRQDLFPYTSVQGGIEKIELQKAIQELEVTNGKGTFKINKDEW